MRARLFALGVAIALSAPLPARGQGTDDRARSLALFEQSEQAYKEGRFQEAIDRLVEARRLYKSPVLLYDMGRAYEALGKPEEAATAFTAYLAEEPQTPDRGAIEGRITTLRAQAAELARARQPKPPPPRPAPPPPPPRSEVAVVPWIVAGVGVATIGVGAGLGLAAKGKHDDAVAEPIQAASRDDQDRAEGLARASTITFVAGGVIATVGLAWLGVRALSGPSVALGPRSIALGARF